MVGSKDVIFVSKDLAGRCMWFYVFFGAFVLSNFNTGSVLLFQQIVLTNAILYDTWCPVAVG